ncbi:hypothetical protein CTEN210_12044 [Chaetoceros tenuissimus]|uniref:Uncharacterized protein n=1 Tax=Chaetoceros tenuissimus TaxID=426638 RepID=A0AAD3D0F5_9STRA|nr:hypothetical protein CTEN210_12044 [Chaetoceros tenuissimus]
MPRRKAAMTTTSKISESGRKRARSGTADLVDTAASTKKNKSDCASPTSASDVLRVNKIATKLSGLLREFPEVKFIIDFQNLQAITETAVVKYAEEREAKNYRNESLPLYSLPDEVLSNCLSFVGKGYYGVVGLVSKKLNETYKREFGQETAYLEMATSVELANHCLNELCKNLEEKDEILKAAAVNGNLDILRDAVKDGYDLFPLVAMKKKTKNPNVDSDEDEDMYDSDSRVDRYNSGYDEENETFDVYYTDDCKNQSSGRPQTVDLAKLVERGHFHVLKYLHEELHYKLGLQRYWQPAIEYGKLQILRWLRKIGIMNVDSWDNDLRIGSMIDGHLNTEFDSCECAIKSGNVEVLKWLQKVGGYEINDNEDFENSYVLEYAIGSKSTKMIQYCLDIGYNNLDDVQYAISWSMSVEVFRFMYELGYDFGGEMKRWYDSKSKGDYLEIMKFLRSISIPWDDGIMKHIVENGTLEMIQYAFEDGCPWTGEEFSHLFKWDHFESSSWSSIMDKFNYLKDNGCTFDYEQKSDLIKGLARKKELLPFEYFVGKNSRFDKKLFKEILEWNGAWFEGISYLLEKGKDVKNFKSIEEVFRTRPYIGAIKSFHRLGLPWCLDSSKNTHLLSKIACHNKLEDVKWAYENGCNGGNLVPYVEKEWGKEWRKDGIRHSYQWKENHAFFEENGMLDEAFLEKSEIKKLNAKNVLQVGDAQLSSYYGISLPRKDSFFRKSLCSLKNLVDHGYTFMSKSEQDFVCKEAYKQCCENSQNEDQRKRLALFVGMGNRDELRKKKGLKTKGRKKKSASLSFR